MVMNSKILPIHKPPIYGRLHHGLPLSTISMENDSFQQWFYSNYIQLFCYEAEGGSYELNFYDCIVFEHRFPNFWVEKIKKETLKEIISPRLSSFVERCIQQDRYVITFFDEFLLPLKNQNKKHIVRDCMIIGYDADRQILNIVGFKKNGQLGMEEVSYSELDHAFDNTPNLLPWDNYIYLLTPLPGSDYTFDGGWVIENIRHYLESTDSLASARLYTKRPPSLYGVNALRRFAKELEEGAFRGNHYIASHILWEHKKCMRDRFIYMMNNQSYDGVILNSFIARFDKIYRDAEVLKNMSLRANLTSDRSLPRRMSSQIKAICENDIEVLTEILPLLVELNAAREFIPERSL